MKEYKIGTVCVDKVIVCNKELRGNGENNPYRLILQIYTTDGELIAENDPYRLSYEEIDEFLKKLTTKLALLNNDHASQFTITQQTRMFLFSFFGMQEQNKEYLK